MGITFREWRERSFILYKPDGMVHGALRSYVEQELADLSRGPSMICRLSLSDIQYLWPNRMGSDRPLVATLFTRYMFNRYVEVQVFRGVDAVSRCDLVKRFSRRRFGQSPFANCVHAPLDEFEAVDQLDYLFSRSSPRINSAPRKANIETRALWGRTAACSKSELIELSHQAWVRAREVGWSNLRTYEPCGPGVSLVLLDDTNEPLDFVVSSLCEVLPELPVSEALNWALHAAATGFCCVARGAEHSIDDLAERLRGLGHSVCILGGRKHGDAPRWIQDAWASRSARFSNLSDGRKDS